jgi:hypothetical protein
MGSAPVRQQRIGYPTLVLPARPQAFPLMSSRNLTMHRTNVSRRPAAQHCRCVEPLENRQLFATFTVLNLNPTGPGSLDQAVLDANAAVGEDTITFDAAVSGIIDLDASPLMITDDVGIQGPGATVLTVIAGGGGPGP